MDSENNREWSTPGGKSCMCRWTEMLLAYDECILTISTSLKASNEIGSDVMYTNILTSWYYTYILSPDPNTSLTDLHSVT